MVSSGGLIFPRRIIEFALSERGQGVKGIRKNECRGKGVDEELQLLDCQIFNHAGVSPDRTAYPYAQLRRFKHFVDTASVSLPSPIFRGAAINK